MVHHLDCDHTFLQLAHQLHPDSMLLLLVHHLHCDFNLLPPVHHLDLLPTSKSCDLTFLPLVHHLDGPDAGSKRQREIGFVIEKFDALLDFGVEGGGDGVGGIDPDDGDGESVSAFPLVNHHHVGIRTDQTSQVAV